MAVGANTQAMTNAAADANHMSASLCVDFMAAPAANGPTTALIVYSMETALTFLAILPDLASVLAIRANVSSAVMKPPKRNTEIMIIV